MHVETSFDRNLGRTGVRDLIHARTGTPGRFMKAEAER
jgi:hypothetical protein